MFTNQERLSIYTIKANSIIPPITSQHLKKIDQLTCYQLQKLVLLIMKQYGLTKEDVKAEFNSSAPENVQVFLCNGLYGFDVPDVDEVNIVPIEFLKTHDGEVAKDDTGLGQWSNSIVTLNSGDLPNIIIDLEYLIDHGTDLTTSLKRVF